MRTFNLEDHHIRYGHLPDETFGLYAGHRVICISLDDFPHWDKLAANRPLTPAERNDRLFAVHLALDFRPGWGLQKLSRMVNKEHISATRYAASYPCLSNYPSANSEPYFEAVVHKGIDSEASFAKANWPLPIRKRYAVFPDFGKRQSMPLNFKAAHLSVVMRDNTEDAKSYWARLLDMPLDRLRFYASDDMHLLYTEMHEMRHLRQISTDSFLGETSFFCEGDADYFADKKLEQKGVGAQTRVMWRHVRYYSVLKASAPIHWIGPLLDSLGQGVEPPAYSEIYLASYEILTRLGLDALDIPHEAISSDDLQLALATGTFHLERRCADTNLLETVKKGEKAYLSNVAPLLRSEPEIIVSALREMTERGVFTQLLSRSIATKILAAAAYFNPELPYASNARLKMTLFNPSPELNW